DRKSTRLNSSHLGISYAVFCLKKKKENNMNPKIKNLFAIVLVFAASVTMLLALPRSKHASRILKPLSVSSILLDPTFNAPFFATQAPPSRGVLLPDGTYVLFFNIDTSADQN